jgi:hypothetical protein
MNSLPVCSLLMRVMRRAKKRKDINGNRRNSRSQRLLLLASLDQRHRVALAHYGVCASLAPPSSLIFSLPPVNSISLSAVMRSAFESD